MSIAVLTQVYDEARRLAVAGSVVARGDFRLKKLLPPLDQAAAKAPVFAKVAEAARAVVGGPEDTSANNLLELTSLVTAVLYTQGETGAAGELAPLETVDLGASAAQTSARLLKPLLEALTNTGSGRLELVKEAHQRGAFRDLRLVKPALDGLDDPYAEVADFLAADVLPVYGKAILPELRAKYDPKGTKGHPRRLKLMHALDPAGTRELVTQALEVGSKDVKVAAIGLLGAKEDLPFLIEQASAKAQDVRAAAYQSLARIDDPAAVVVLEKALNGKDYQLAAAAVEHSKNVKLDPVLAAAIRRGLATLPDAGSKKEVGERVHRVSIQLASFPAVVDPAVDDLVLDLFARRHEFLKYKGEPFSGADLVETITDVMAEWSKPTQVALARAHAGLDAAQLGQAFAAARAVLPAAEVYDLFAPYLLVGDGGKKKGKDAAGPKRDAILQALDADDVRWYYVDASKPPLDPRWLDLAVKIGHLGLIHAAGRPGHTGAEAFLQAEFDAALQGGAKAADRRHDVVTVMVRLGHPRATDALLAAYEKEAGKAGYPTYWFHQLIPLLPKDAIPRLEAVLPKLKEREADYWLAAIQELRTKP